MRTGQPRCPTCGRTGVHVQIEECLAALRSAIAVERERVPAPEAKPPPKAIPPRPIALYRMVKKGKNPQTCWRRFRMGCYASVREALRAGQQLHARTPTLRLVIMANCPHHIWLTVQARVGGRQRKRSGGT